MNVSGDSRQSGHKQLPRSRVGAVYSAVVGAWARTPVPSGLRSMAYRTFSRMVGANLDEVAEPLRNYRSFGDFFARELRDGARPVADTALVMPSDGALGAWGAIDATDTPTIVQAKGRNYTLAAFLADADYAKQFEGGTYVTIYLSPRDYHRVHAPCDGTVTQYTYVPGTLWPVSQRFIANVDELFARNERVIVRFRTAFGPVAAVLVGAAGVGNMSMRYLAGDDGAAQRAPAPGRQSRRLRGAAAAIDYACDAAVTRGDEIGAFHLGSTVVLVLPRGVHIEPFVAQRVVQMGAPLARLATQIGPRA